MTEAKGKKCNDAVVNNGKLEKKKKDQMNIYGCFVLVCLGMYICDDV